MRARLAHISLVACVFALSQAVCGCARPAGKTAADRVQEDPTGYKELLRLGLSFAQAQDDDRAEQYLSAALERGADPNTALGPLLRTCIRAKRYQAAIQHAEAYVERVTLRRETEMVLASLYLAVGQSDRAKAHLEYVVENYAAYPLGHFLLATVLQLHEQDAKRADQHFRTYLSLEPDGAYVAQARNGLLKSVSETETLPSVQAN